MAFSTAGFMGGLAQLIQGRQQNALADQQAKEKLDERRLQLGLQADQIRKQKIDEERARLTFEEQQKDWLQRGQLRPIELDAAKTNRDLGRANLEGTYVNNDIAALNRDTLRKQQPGRDKLFDLSVATPRHQEMSKLTEGLIALDNTINSQSIIANDVTKSMPEREAALMQMRNAHNSKYALFNNAKSRVGSVPDLTYADIATAAGIRQPDPTKPIDWNTYNNWESHFPAFTTPPLKQVLAASPEGLKALTDLTAGVSNLFDPTKHIVGPKTFFSVIKGTDDQKGRPTYTLSPDVPKFTYDKSKLANEYFASPAFTSWLKGAAATNRSTEAKVVQELLGAPLTPTTYDSSGKIKQVGDVDKDGKLIMTPSLSNRIAAVFSSRVPTPEKLSEIIDKQTSQYTDQQRNAITFWTAQLTSGDTRKTAEAARLTANLSAQNEVFKSASDLYMKNANAVDANLAAIQKTLGVLTGSAVASVSAIFGEEIKANATKPQQELITQFRQLYRKKELATAYWTAASQQYAMSLQDGAPNVAGYTAAMGKAANIFNAPYREFTKEEKDLFKSLGMTLASGQPVTPAPNPGKANGGAAGVTAPKPGLGGNQAGAGLGVPSNTPLSTFKTNGIDNRQR